MSLSHDEYGLAARESRDTDVASEVLLSNYGRAATGGRIDDFVADGSACPATTDSTTARPSKTPDFAGLANLPQARAQIV